MAALANEGRLLQGRGNTPFFKRFIKDGCQIWIDVHPLELTSADH
jgi:hypothetical protein